MQALDLLMSLTKYLSCFLNEWCLDAFIMELSRARSFWFTDWILLLFIWCYYSLICEIPGDWRQEMERNNCCIQFPLHSHKCIVCPAQVLHVLVASLWADIFLWITRMELTSNWFVHGAVITSFLSFYCIIVFLIIHCAYCSFLKYAIGHVSSLWEAGWAHLATECKYA